MVSDGGMECACACDISDCDFEWYLHHSDKRKARKEWKCEECGALIDKGDEYMDHTGVGRDCGWVTFRNCLTCECIRRDYGCGYGNLHETVSECLGVDL